MATSAIAPVTSTGSAGSSSSSSASASGLDFTSLLQIILTQLQYQDPLKPMDNFEFVSQLAQFTQIEQGQTETTDLQTVATSQSTLEATSILGKTVDVTTSTATLTGTVSAVTFSSGTPQITIQTTDGQTVSGLALTAISAVR